ncbi:hypothetical protein ACB092_11G271500 [Castanea dentata]
MNGQPEPKIHHFSHQHPLQLSNCLPQQTLNLALCCAGCKLGVSGSIYCCTFCSYFLHISKGLFNCDACGKEGNSFSYHCGLCNIDLHTTCASMPLMLSHQSHYHQLNLTFSSPDDNKSFSYDICMEQLGVKQWRY